MCFGSGAECGATPNRLFAARPFCQSAGRFGRSAEAGVEVREYASVRSDRRVVLDVRGEQRFELVETALSGLDGYQLNEMVRERECSVEADERVDRVD